MNRVQPKDLRLTLWSGCLVATLLVLTAGCAGGDFPSTALPTGGPGSTGGIPSAAPPSATSAPQSLGTDDIGRLLAAGTYQVGGPFGVPTTITVPAGWELHNVDEGDVYFSGGGSWIVIDLLENVFADPCQSAGGPSQPPVAPTVDAIGAALAGMTGFTAGPMSDLALGNHTGKAFDLQNAIRTERANCYQIDRLPMWTNRAGTEQWTIGGSREQMWVVDVEGTPIVVDRGGSGVDEVAESIRFGSPVAWVAPTPTPTPTGPRLSYVALGDSLLFAAEEDCNGCTSAAVLYGQRVETDLGIPVDVHNLTMHNGLSSPMLLGYFERGVKLGRDPEDLFAAVANADIISLTIGFNDASTPDPNTIPALRRTYEANLDGILSRMVELRGGKPTAIRVTNLYNNGGSSWTAVVQAMNDVACDVARQHDAICVDIYGPFMGPNDLGPIESGYLGADQTHPSQLGMEVIADALAAPGYAPLP